jgi:hypothetical protein
MIVGQALLPVVCLEVMSSHGDRLESLSYFSGPAKLARVNKGKQERLTEQGMQWNKSGEEGSRVSAINCRWARGIQAGHE